MIELCAASLLYHDHGREVFACQDIDLKVEVGEFLAILGPSGSGKSSLLYLLSGLKIPTSGQVLYETRDLSRLSDAERSRIRLHDFGFVFQQPFLLGYLTALENVMISDPGEDVLSEARTILESLGLGDKVNRLPHELSGGERQRVCIGRALLGGPKVVFADEPTAALDHKNGRHVVDLLDQHRGGGALVMVTHDPSMIENATRVLRIAEGRIVSLETPSEALKSLG